MSNQVAELSSWLTEKHLERILIGTIYTWLYTNAPQKKKNWGTIQLNIEKKKKQGNEQQGSMPRSRSWWYSIFEAFQAYTELLAYWISLQCSIGAKKTALKTLNFLKINYV